MTAKQIFAAIGILCAIASLVFTGTPLLVAGIVSIGVSVLIP